MFLVIAAASDAREKQRETTGCVLHLGEAYVVVTPFLQGMLAWHIRELSQDVR